MSQLSDQKSSLFGKPKGPNDKTTTSSAIRQTPKPTTTTTKPTSKTISTNSTNKNSNGIVLSPAVIARKLEEAKEESAIGQLNLHVYIDAKNYEQKCLLYVYVEMCKYICMYTDIHM
jgi:hypothetical protein